MKYNQLRIRIKRIFLMIIFIVVFFIFVTPTAFVRFINGVLEGVGFGSLVHGIFKTFLPSLLLLVFQDVILYNSVNYIVAQEKRTSKSMELASKLTYFLLFLGFYVFLLQVLGLQTIFYATINGWDVWRQDLVYRLSATGVFFSVFILHQGFLKGGLILLNPGKVISPKIKFKMAKTELEKLRALEAKEFNFAWELAISLNTFLIVIGLSLLYPLILPIGVIFFFFRVIDI